MREPVQEKSASLGPRSEKFEDVSRVLVRVISGRSHLEKLHAVDMFLGHAWQSSLHVEPTRLDAALVS